MQLFEYLADVARIIGISKTLEFALLAQKCWNEGKSKEECGAMINLAKAHGIPLTENKICKILKKETATVGNHKSPFGI